MTQLTLHHRDILNGPARAHVTRATLTSQRPRHLHQHDFYEVFWVQNGTVRHHRPNGPELLTEGDLIFLCPGQAHGLQAKGDAAMVALICLHPEVVDDLIKRFPTLSGGAFRSDDPLRIRRDIRQMATLNQSAIALEQSNRDALATTAFLLPLLTDVLATQRQFPSDLPDWLAQACAAAYKPDVFREGAAGLVAISGKAHPHVSRTMRRYLGKTPSDYINDIRMSYAARALVTDTDPLADIATQ